MQVRTSRELVKCIEIFQESIQKRPLKLKAFPFRCGSPQISGDRASISASFQIAEPYGTVKMECQRQGDVTLIEFSANGNIRGTITANSMAKYISSKLS